MYEKKLSILKLLYEIPYIKVALLISILLSLFVQLLGLAQPFFFQFVIDEIILSQNLSILPIITIFFILLFFCGTLVNSLRQYYLLGYKNKCKLYLQVVLKKHLLDLPANYFSSNSVGAISNNFYSFQQILNSILQFIPSLIFSSVTSLVTFYIMLTYSMILTLFAVIYCVILLLIKIVTYPAIKRYTDKVYPYNSQSNSLFIESLKNIFSVKLFSLQSRRLNNWITPITNSYRYSTKSEVIRINSRVVSELFRMIDMGLTYSFGAVFIIDANMTLGMFIAFLSFKVMFAGSINQLVESVYGLKLQSVHLGRLENITKIPKEKGITHADKCNYYKSDNSYKNEVNTILNLSNFSFKYNDDQDNILKNINFKFNKNTVYVLTGPSGEGKTTLCNCILGFYDNYEGQILFNNIDIQTNIIEYRKKISAVMQEDSLFIGTIAENISLFDTNIDSGKVIFYAKKAEIHEYIEKLPMKYDTPINDIGSVLSGGQKQRIYIARALYKEASFLILDEGTSQLDLMTEKIILNNICSLDITCLIISHRPQTIEFADEHIDIKELSK